MVAQLTEKQVALGWSKTNVREAVGMYQMFLYLCWKYPRKVIVPTFEVDLVWHEHILHTKKYAADCEMLFGKFLHHNPSNESSETKIYNGFRETLKLIRKEFYSSAS